MTPTSPARIIHVAVVHLAGKDSLDALGQMLQTCLTHLHLAAPDNVEFRTQWYDSAAACRAGQATEAAGNQVLLLTDAESIAEFDHEYSIIALSATPIAGVTTIAPADIAPRALCDALVRAARHLDVRREISFIEHHDPATKLPNASAFAAYVEQSISLSEGNTIVFVVAVDAFDELVFSLHRSNLDALLAEIAERLSELPGTAVVARYETSSFLVLANNDASTGADKDSDKATLQQAEDIARAIHQSVSGRITLENVEAFITVSIGHAATSASATEQDADQLIANATAASESAMNAGSGHTFRADATDADKNTMRSSAIRDALPQALEREEFTLHFQPQMSLETGAVSGAEALLRWHGESVGSISPDQFIPMAEESGSILPIGRWVLQEACRQAHDWLSRFWTTVRLSVNVSSRQLAEPTFAESIDQMLADYALHPGQLELELPERELLDLDDDQLRVLRSLRDLGISIAVDDFGTTHAPASYLKSMPIDVIKLDHSLVAGVATDAADGALVRAIIQMAHGLGLRVLAEGVETPGQLEFLRISGCDEAQGFYLGHPMPADELIVLVHDQPRFTDQTETRSDKENFAP